MNGTFGFVYCGIRGVGIGVFVITNGQLRGCDMAGTKYSGHVSEIPGSSTVKFSIKTDVPPGVYLVQGTSEQDMAYSNLVEKELPADFYEGKPIQINLGHGPVTLMISRQPDDFAVYADGFEIVQKKLQQVA